MDKNKTKSELRRMLLKQRRSLSVQEWQEKSDRICNHLESFYLFKEAKTILAYFSIRQEPDLSNLFKNNYQWGFSRCVDKCLIWHRWQSGEFLHKSNYNILEPDATAPIIKSSEVDLILVPAVACDHKRYRLGYGGGYYDRLFSFPEWATKPTIGIIFDFAYLSQLPIDNWDQPLSYICTETGINS